MALTQCSSCGGKLSTEAEKCPHCGITKLAAKKEQQALLAKEQQALLAKEQQEERKKQQVFEARSALAKAYWKPFVLVVLLSSIGVFVYLNKPEKTEIVRTYYTVPPSLLPDSSKLKSETTYVGGVENGPYRTYYESGELNSVGTYVDGELNGPYWGLYSDSSRESRSYTGYNAYLRLNDQHVSSEGSWDFGEACGEWYEAGLGSERIWRIKYGEECPATKVFVSLGDTITLTATRVGGRYFIDEGFVDGSKRIDERNIDPEIWATSDSTVATVNSTGLVIALASGTAEITASSKNGYLTGMAVVTIAETPTESERR